MLSQKTRYALKAALALAEHEKDEPLMISDIAERQNVPRKFLELILLELKHHGLVYSRRGKHGGYVLARPPEEITFGQIIRVTDGPLAAISCVSKTAYRRCDDCRDEAACAIRRVFLEVRESTARILDGTTLADALQATEGGLIAMAAVAD